MYLLQWISDKEFFVETSGESISSSNSWQRDINKAKKFNLKEEAIYYVMSRDKSLLEEKYIYVYFIHPFNYGAIICM